MLLKIEVKGVDILIIDDINNSLIELLTEYNNIWYNSTGLVVETYAAHGSQLPMNLALSNFKLLNQICLLETGLYKFETTSNFILRKLNWIHDTYRPEWIENPEMIEDGVYQILIYPDIWVDPQAWRDEYGHLYP